MRAEPEGPEGPEGIDPRTLELFHKVADGSVDAIEREECARLLAASPELGKELEAVQYVVGQLNAIPLVEPPDLKPAILGELERRRSVRSAAAALSPSRARRWQRPLLAWAAGIALIVGASYFLGRDFASGISHVDPSEAAATMGARPVHAWRVVETLEPGISDAGLNLVLRVEGDRYALEAQRRDAGSPGTAELRWDARDLECVGVEGPGQDLETLNRAGSIALSASPQAGTQVLRPVVILRPRSEFDKPKEVVLLVGGKEYLRATIPAK